MRYEIKGKVIDAKSRAGVGGVRVEAWGKGLALEDDLGYAATLYDGTFTIPLDEDTYRDLFGDRCPDIYFDVCCGDEVLVSTEDSALWKAEAPDAYMTIEIPPLQPPVWEERHVYLKIKRLDAYSPVKPLDEEAGRATYGRDCMRNEGHENGFIPQSEIEARTLDAVVYQEFLDSAYLIPKPDKLIPADINEPLYEYRVPGTVIYARPYQRLRIHVWNTDDVPHSLHAHGLRYGIDSDGTWPFGTQSSSGGGRSDAICPGETWCYTFDVTYDMIGAWPFHDYTHHSNIKIEQGLFGGIVVLGYCDRAPRPFRFREGMLAAIYADLERSEGRSFSPENVKINFDKDSVPFIFAPLIHLKRFKPETVLLLRHHLDFVEEFVSAALSQPGPHIPTDHVPVFLHRMSANTPPLPKPQPPVLQPVLDPGRRIFDLALGVERRALDFAVLNELRPLDQAVRVGGIPTLCINGRGFVGNSPTIAARAGQRIRWYVFNLDIATNGHNFHPHGMAWKFAGESIDTRSFGPGESFVAEATIPPVLLLTEEEARIQNRQYRPENAKLYCVKGDFLFHCHEQQHLLAGMAGLVRSRQSFWLTPEMAEQISRRTGLPVDDGGNACPDVEPNPCGIDRIGHWEQIAGIPEVLLMHSVLLPNTKRVLFWGQTSAAQSRIWDYSTPAGAYLSPANQPADLTGDVNTSNLWSGAHALLNTPEGLVLIHGGFTPNRSFNFNPSTLTWTQVTNTADDRFYATTLVIGDGRALTLFGSASKSIEAYTHGVGWAPPIVVPAQMNQHQYYPWTYLLPDGKLFIAGPHVPTQRFDFNAPAGVESFPTNKGDRTNPGEKGTSVLLILRPPDYKPIVYIMGGEFPAVSKSAEQIDLSVPTPAWVNLPDLQNARAFQFTATLLPDGRVFIAGGMTGGPDGGPCEIFDPRNPGAGWVQGPNMKFERTYHSSFLLLQDGSILGGGAPPNFPPPAVLTPHERFFPGYFDKLRPVIGGAPATINYGGNFTVNTPTPADISEVVLLRAGAVTHGFNMSQRGIECVIAGIGPGTLNVQSPPNANLAPPGWYLLFILDWDRVPSEGRWIHLT